VTPVEIHTETGLEAPTPRRAAHILGRALLLRCPHCGGRPMLRHWLRMRERCPRCGLRVERGERDYFIGSMMFNLVLAELLFAAAFVAALVSTWPDVPWDTMEWLAPLAMLAAPLLLFPFSKLVWLAFDVMFRPVTEAELEWHRTTEETV
jgi:uncharacterized protein (DUF983 family)